MNASSSRPHCLLPETEQKARRDTVLRDMLANALDVRELEDGLSLRFPGNDAWFRKLADFVSFEQACCPFLAFELSPEPDDRTITLTVRGPVEATDFLHNGVRQLQASIAERNGEAP